MITSKSNKKIKDISLLIKKSGFRKETGLFISRQAASLKFF